MSIQATGPAITVGDQMPRVQFVTIDGRHVRYRDLWQRRHLILVSLRSANGAGAREYVQQLRAREAELTAYDTALVIREAAAGGDQSASAAGVPAPSVLLVDRWGEVYHIDAQPSESQLPDPDAILEWLRFTQSQCPECDPK
jgi:hypothetical protein